MNGDLGIEARNNSVSIDCPFSDLDGKDRFAVRSDVDITSYTGRAICRVNALPLNIPVQFEAFAECLEHRDG